MSHPPQMRRGRVAFSSLESGSTAELASAELVRRLAAHLDPLALGASVGIVSGFLVFAATMILVIKGGEQVGTHLALLAFYWPGYQVTVGGSLLGTLYGSVTGFVLGWVTAQLRNGLLNLYLTSVRLWANLSRTYFLDRFD